MDRGLASITGQAKHAVARAVFGNDAWWANNVGQRRALAQARQDDAQPVPTRSRDQVGRLDQLGFLTIDPDYPRELIEVIQRGYAELIDEDDRCVDMGGRIPDVVRYINDPVASVPELKQLLSPPVLDVVDGYYGAAWTLQHLRMWRIKHVPAADQGVHHYGNLWHCDHHPASMLKLFVQISDDVTASGGAFRFHDVPDTRRIMRSGYVDQLHSYGSALRALDQPNRVHLFDAPAGGAVLCSTPRVLHRAGVPLEGQSRGMVQLTFVVGPRRDRSADPFESMPVDTSVRPGAIA